MRPYHVSREGSSGGVELACSAEEELGLKVPLGLAMEALAAIFGHSARRADPLPTSLPVFFPDSAHELVGIRIGGIQILRVPYGGLEADQYLVLRLDP